jgi:hypothetical protein
MARLELLSGVVQNLKIANSYEDFVFTKTDKTVAGAAAIGAAAMGQLFSSANLASASGGAEISVQCFTCEVNGMLLAGRFFEVQFKDGDAIEFVVEKTEHGAVVSAARSPSKRMLWMLPHQMRGYLAQKKSDMKWSLILSILAVLVVGVCETLFFKNNGDEPFYYAIIFYISVFLIVWLINIWARSKFTVYAQQATEVIKALGYPNPEQVDLPALGKLAQKKLQAQLGKHPGFPKPWSFRY